MLKNLTLFALGCLANLGNTQVTKITNENTPSKLMKGSKYGAVMFYDDATASHLQNFETANQEFILMHKEKAPTVVFGEVNIDTYPKFAMSGIDKVKLP